MTAVLDVVACDAIEHDKQDAVNILEKQAKELRHNGNAPGNSWRDTADVLMWSYHDRVGHVDPYGVCPTCRRWMPVLLKRKDPLLTV